MYVDYKHLDRSVYLQLGHALQPDVAVLAADIWAFVDHHFAKDPTLARCRYFWRQAQQFSRGLGDQPYASQPLHLYYCMLNATKAMILSRPSITTPNFEYHGLSFTISADPPPPAPPSDGLLSTVSVKGDGVFRELCRWMGDVVPPNRRFSLIDLLREVPCGHRAFCTATGEAEVFTALATPMKLREDRGTFRFEAKLPEHVDVNSLLLPKGLYLLPKERAIRTQNKKLNPAGGTFLADLAAYHRVCRRSIQMIQGVAGPSHYFRSAGPSPHGFSQISLNFAVAFALSSLARYQPETLERVFDDPRGWIVKEYLRTALQQQIAFIAAEITGRIIQQPYGAL
jgi:hypothetical protein